MKTTLRPEVKAKIERDAESQLESTQSYGETSYQTVEGDYSSFAVTESIEVVTEKWAEQAEKLAEALREYNEYESVAEAALADYEKFLRREKYEKA